MLVSSQPDDMQVPNDQVMQLLAGLVKASVASAKDADDTRIDDASQEIDAQVKLAPPSDFSASLPRKLKERRKVSNSFRIRSADSDTSSTNDEADAELSEAENLMDTSMSGIGETSVVDVDVDVKRMGTDRTEMQFPSNGDANDHPPSAYQASSSRRKLTTSDPSTPGDGARFGFRGPGSASGKLPPSSFARPTPPGSGARSRRGSEGSAVDDSTPGRAFSGRSMRPDSASPTTEVSSGCPFTKSAPANALLSELWRPDDSTRLGCIPTSSAQPPGLESSALLGPVCTFVCAGIVFADGCAGRSTV